jgi:hypothetical protein
MNKLRSENIEWSPGLRKRSWRANHYIMTFGRIDDDDKSSSGKACRRHPRGSNRLKPLLICLVNENGG